MDEGEGEVWAGVKATRQADAPQKLALFSASIFQHEEHDGDDLRASSVIALRPFLLLHSHHLHLYLFLPHDFPLQLFLFFFALLFFFCLWCCLFFPSLVFLSSCSCFCYHCSRLYSALSLCLFISCIEHAFTPLCLLSLNQIFERQQAPTMRVPSSRQSNTTSVPSSVLKVSS